MVDELNGFSIKVRRQKDPPWPYIWEIYRAEERNWIKRSMHGYASRQQAAEAGRRALHRILEQKMADSSK
jgi:hypothetical protein